MKKRLNNFSYSVLPLALLTMMFLFAPSAYGQTAEDPMTVQGCAQEFQMQMHEIRMSGMTKQEKRDARRALREEFRDCREAVMNDDDDDDDGGQTGGGNHGGGQNGGGQNGGGQNGGNQGGNQGNKGGRKP